MSMERPRLTIGWLRREGTLAQKAGRRRDAPCEPCARPIVAHPRACDPRLIRGEVTTPETYHPTSAKAAVQPNIARKKRVSRPRGAGCGKFVFPQENAAWGEIAG